MTWAAAIERATREERNDPPEDVDLPSGVVPPPARSADPRPTDRLEGAELVVTDHFDLMMIDMSLAGACLTVEPIARADAAELVRKHGAVVATMSDRGQTSIERELQLEPAPRPQVKPGTRLIVMHFVRYNDIRWFLVELIGTKNGEVSF